VFWYRIVDVCHSTTLWSREFPGGAMRTLVTSVSAAIGIIVLIAGLVVSYDYIENGGSILLGCAVVLLTSLLTFLLSMGALAREK